MEAYITTLLGSACILLGGIVIKQDRKRIDKLEEEQSETTKLLHELNGKVDIIVDHVRKNGNKTTC